MLDPRQYLQQVLALQVKYAARKTSGMPGSKGPDQDELNCVEFASANLRHLLPEIPVERHAGIINKILFNQAQAAMDEDSCFLTGSTDIVDTEGILPAAQNKPVIFCTYHFGSYRIINQVLGSRGLNYLLPVAADIYAEQKQRYEENFATIKEYFHSKSQLIVINAEERTSALSMARKTKAGWSLLTYIDGNTGVQGASRQDSKMLKISLLGKPIYARKGIAFLSHFLKLPIVPVVCEVTDSMERRMTFHHRIEPSSGEQREAYCLRATEKLYSVLAEYLKKTPEQWEGWTFMQRYLDTDSIVSSFIEDPGKINAPSGMSTITGSKLVFNHSRYGFIVQENERVLLDKASYKLLSLPDQIRRVLEAYGEPQEVSVDSLPEVDRDVIEQLVTMDMLSVVRP